MTQYSEFLDRISEDAERPKPLPPGSYVCTVQANPREDKSTRQGTEFIEFTLQPIEALKDVDERALAEMGGIADASLRVTFWYTLKSEWRLRTFLDNCNIPGSVADKSQPGGRRKLKHWERIDQSAGRQVIAYVKHQPSEDGQMMYANVVSTAPVE